MPQELGLADGDELLVTVEGKRLMLESKAALLECLHETVGRRLEGESVSEALIAGRRAEAVRELSE